MRVVLCVMFLHLAARTRSDESSYYYTPTATKWELDTAAPRDAVDMATNTTNVGNWSTEGTKCEGVEPKAVFLYVHVFKVLYS